MLGPILLALIALDPTTSSTFSSSTSVGARYDFLDPTQRLKGPRVTQIVPRSRTHDVLVNRAASGGQHLGCTVQSEASVAGHGRFVYVGFNDGSACVDNLGATGSRVQLTGFARSTDGGETFEDLGPLKPNGQVFSLLGDPVVAVDTTGRAKGTVYLASLAADRQGRWYLAVGRSSDHGRTFQWNRVLAGADPDKEWLAVDNSGGPRDGTLYLTWLEFGAPPGINVLASTDGGRTWSRRHRVETPRNGGAQGARVAVGPDGELHVVWERALGDAWGKIRWTQSFDGGRTYSKPRTIGTMRPIRQDCSADEVQGVRVNEFPSIAIDTFGSARRGTPNYNPSRGTAYVVFAGRGRSGDAADIFLTRLPSGSRQWAPQQRVNDDKTSHDQFFPEVVATGPGDIAISWTDRREDAAETAAPQSGNWLMRQWMATSTNAGRTVSPNKRFSDVLFPPPLTNPSPNTGIAECYAGDYNGLYSTGRNRVIAAWGDNRDSLLVAGMPSVLIPDQNVYFRKTNVHAD